LLYIAIPAIENNLGVEVIRVSMPLENITFYEISLLKQIGIASVIGIIIAFLIGLKFVGAFLKPINELNDATQKISDGNFHNRIHIRSDDELSNLANNFNKMSHELEIMIAELNESNNIMDAVLSSMNNSLIAVDTQHEVLFLNRAFEKKFNINELKAKGQALFQLIDDERLKKYLKELLKDNDQNSIEFSTENGRIFNIYSTTILENNDEMIGTLITLQDVTDMKKLEKVRSDFVANVSHELRTPLTSIRGFIETLKDGAINDEQVREKFLEIIDMEVTRLTTLIEDILVLSDIENNYLTSKKQKIDLVEMSYNVIDMLKPLAKKKDIQINYEFDEHVPMISANKSWTKQMIINLVDNAIKYSNQDGTIDISVHHRLNNIVLTIADEGIGIASEDLDRLFERFYRVDKARSRDLGGTGLGLAIVKHVVLALNGKVNVQSEPGKGTKFTINIPVKSFKQ
jgi:two-component system phosphate regulon sensor histidine kinase PhoR